MFLTDAENTHDMFAPDFVSFNQRGDALDGAKFAKHFRTLLGENGSAELMWCERGASDSLCIAFKLPKRDGQVTKHLSLWRQTGSNWKKQFHIFVEGEESLQKSASLA